MVVPAVCEVTGGYLEATFHFAVAQLQKGVTRSELVNVLVRNAVELDRAECRAIVDAASAEIGGVRGRG
jgi:hypothetical protein